MQVAVDAARTVLPTAGTVRVVTKWEGGRSTDIPEVSPSGLPLYDIDVFVKEVNFGREETKVYAVRVPASTVPEATPGQVLQFEQLMVDFYPSKGGMRVQFSAAGIAAAPVSASTGRNREAA